MQGKTETGEPGNMGLVTLVMCYPFYYVASALKRFVVRVERSGERRKLRQKSHHCCPAKAG